MKMKADLIKQDTISVYNKSLHSGRPLDKSEHPDLDKQEFTSLIKFILYTPPQNEAISLSYSSKLRLKKHLERLNIEEGISWEEVMQQAIRKEGVHM